MDSELARPSTPNESQSRPQSQSSKLSSVDPSGMETGDSNSKAGNDDADADADADGNGDSGSGSDSDDDATSNDGDSEPPPQVEWLATGRQRRTTAGNRMKSMLANEEPDSDLELLFAEDENDQGFSDAGENVSDVQMDSSSSDDDNNNNDDDELEGEKELDQQAKERRAAQRKRKAQDAIPVKFRKRVRIDTSASTPPSSVATPQPQPQSQAPSLPRPKKKSERTSWLPSVADMPTRASSRKTTRLSKEQLHAQMEEREAKRLKQLAQMQKKAARLEALKKPPMTQEERLREAAIVEERNSKSLNRWEEAEKQREEERRAKLAALHERTLSGPVISFWSGMGRFNDGWLKGEGIHVAVEEKPKRAKRERPAKGGSKKRDETNDTAVKEGLAGDSKPAQVQTAPVKTEAINPDDQLAPPQSVATTFAEASAGNGEAKVNPNHASTTNSAQDVSMAEVPTTQESKEATTLMVPKAQLATEQHSRPDASKHKVAHVAMVKGPVKETPENSRRNEIQSKAEQSDSRKVGATSKTKHVEASAKEKEAEAPTNYPSEPVKPTETFNKAIEKGEDPKSACLGQNGAPSGMRKVDEGAYAAPTGKTTLDGKKNTDTETTKALQSETTTPQLDSAQGRSPLDGLATTRNAIIFQNFAENAIKDKNIQIQVLFGRKMNRLPKPTAAPICPITNNHARYRDPRTRLHFYNAAAFKELQRVQRGEYRWSKLLGAWVGSGVYAAKGVPERFLNPARCPTLEEVQRIERKREERVKAEKRRQQQQQQAEEEEEKKKKAEMEISGMHKTDVNYVGASAGETTVAMVVGGQDCSGVGGESENGVGGGVGGGGGAKTEASTAVAA